MTTYNSTMTTELPSDAELTSVSLTKGTRNRFKTYGVKGETYDEILVRLMDNYRDPRELRLDENILEQICEPGAEQ